MTCKRRLVPVVNNLTTTVEWDYHRAVVSEEVPPNPIELQPMHIQPLTDHGRLRNVFLIAATFTAIALGVSARTEADQPAAATPAPVQQSAMSVPAELHFPTETPASMAYHDNINVSAIAVAAYDH